MQKVLFEDSHKNRMEEALELFRKITNNKDFENTPIFLFLNKKDLLEQYINENPMSNVFSDFTGEDDVNGSIEFVKNKFQSQLPPGKKVAIHPLAGVVKFEVKMAFDEVKKDLLQKSKKRVEKQVARLKKDNKKIQKKMKT